MANMSVATEAAAQSSSSDEEYDEDDGASPTAAPATGNKWEQMMAQKKQNEFKAVCSFFLFF